MPFETQKQPPKVFSKISQNSQEKTVSESLITKVFSSEICENFSNIFFIEHLRATTSGKK